MTASLEIDGLKEIARALDKMEKRVAINITKAAVRAGAAVIRKEARRNLPSKYDELKRSLTVKVLKKRNPYVTKAIVGPTTGDDAQFDGWYAHLVEFGVSPHEIESASFKSNLVSYESGEVFGKTVNHPGVKKLPFLRPALDNNKAKVLSEMKKKLLSGIEKQALKTRSNK